MGAITEATDKSANSIGMWGRAFRGAFIGAVAGIAFSSIIGGLTGIVEKSYQLVESSVQLAAKFEMSRNAMTLFTGSAVAGRQELGALAEVAKITPGLRLDDAITGATRLRALGFEAKVVQNLVVGLAKQKLISGTDDEGAISRVIVNLQQLQAGSPQIMRDVRQMVLALPSLSIEIQKTFGTYEKFRAALQDDPNSALTRFAEALAKAEAPAGGLDNALGKLEDSFKQAGMTMGEPILEPLTQAAVELTQVVYNNADAWKEWGNYIANAIRGAMDAAHGLSNIGHNLGLDIPDKDAGYLRRGLRIGGRAIVGGLLASTTGGLSTLSDISATAGYYDELRKPLKGMSGTDLARALGPKYGVPPQAKEDPIATQLKGLGATQSSNIDALKSNLAIEQAVRSSYLRNNQAEERKYDQDISQMKLRSLHDQLAVTKASLSAELEVVKGDKDKTIEATAKGEKAINDILRDTYVERANAREKDRQHEQQIAEEHRTAMVQRNELDQRAAKSVLDRVTFDMERQVQLTGSGYDSLADATKSGLGRQTQLLIDNEKLQLQNVKLTADQRKNIEIQTNLDLQDAAEENRRKLIDIRERQYQQEIKNIETFTQKTTQLIQNSLDVFSTVGGAMSTSRVDKAFVGSIAMAFFGGDPDAQVKVFSDKIQELTSIKKAAVDAWQGTDPKATHALQLQVAQWDTLIKQQEEFKQKTIDSQVPIARTIYDTAKAYADGTATLEQYQQAQLGIMDSETKVQLLRFRFQAQDADEKMRKASLAGNDVDRNKYEQEYSQILSDQTKFLFTNAQARQQFYDTTIKGQTEMLAKLSTGDPSTMRDLNDQFRGERLGNQIAGYREIYQLQSEIAAGPYMRALDIEKARLTDIVKLRDDEWQISQKVVYSKAHADVELAGFLAQQKGITDIISDVKINALTTAYSALDAVGNRLTRSFGAFRDVIASLISNLLKLAVNWGASKFFGFGGQAGSTSAGSGGIFGNLVSGVLGGGGMGPGGTPLFNGNAGSGLGGVRTTGDYNTVLAGLLGAGPLSNANGDLGQGGGRGLLGAGMAGGGLFGGGGLSGLGLSIAPLLPILGAGLGSKLGRGSVGGSILGGLGGALVGGAAFAGLGGLGVLYSAGLISAGTSTAAFALLTNPFTIAAGAGLLLASYFIGRSSTRRKEETIRNQAMLDAFSAIDKLISDVDADRIDGTSALEQAKAIRTNYLDQMSKLKDKKTRNIALADVSRIDSKIKLLEAAAGNQTSRKDRQGLMVPTFAAGGMVAPGYQTGPAQIGYFGSSGTYGMFNERGSEYVLDAQTTRNIGVRNLDAIRASRGVSFQSMRDKMPAYVAGGTVGGGSTSGMSGGSPTIELTIQVGLSETEFATVIESTIKQNDGSREQVAAIVNLLKTMGPGNPFVNTITGQQEGKR